MAIARICGPPVVLALPHLTGSPVIPVEGPQEVTALASRVQTEQVFTAGSSSVGEARRFVASALADWDREDDVWCAQLLVSELATNAVLHADTTFTVRLSLHGGVVRLEVDDGVTRSPRHRDYGVDATTGRGVGLVSAMSSGWGVRTSTHGKTVWCELGGPDGDGSGSRSPFEVTPGVDTPSAAAGGLDDTAGPFLVRSA